MIIAEENWKLSQKEDSRSVDSICQYKRDLREAVTPSKRCIWCGEATHGKDAELSVRREKCTAWMRDARDAFGWATSRYSAICKHPQAEKQLGFL